MAIAIVDYCKGNLRNCLRGIESAGCEAFITQDPEPIERADAVVLPGVGAFADASQTMLRTGQMEAVRTAVLERGVPFLGICLGMQLVMERGGEGLPEGQWAEGLGFLKGSCERLADVCADGTKVKVPHVGWNSVDYVPGRDNPLFEGVPDGSFFYFTHSYRSVCDDEEVVVGTTTHAERFPSAIHSGNVFGTQFHPEKSSDAGLAVLRNFARLVYGERLWGGAR
ncbi:MAG: imidazole glycerol phosphate synthase subunit HisH [Coriobacteriales bacterium]